MKGPRAHLLWLSLFAISMAYLEAAVVVYLRSLYYPDDPLVIFPLRVLSRYHLPIELARELATLIMILSVARLAERGLARVFAAFVYVFGVWDIFYYLWLKLIVGWPVSWLDWDILFLIPWPWLGPWIAPVFIAALFTLWGGWVLASARRYRWTWGNAALIVAGAVLALAAFLQPAWPLLAAGEEAFRRYRPGGFWWGLYAPGYLLMATGLLRMLVSSRLQA